MASLPRSFSSNPLLFYIIRQLQNVLKVFLKFLNKYLDERNKYKERNIKNIRKKNKYFNIIKLFKTFFYFTNLLINFFNSIYFLIYFKIVFYFFKYIFNLLYLNPIIWLVKNIKFNIFIIFSILKKRSVTFNNLTKQTMILYDIYYDMYLKIKSKDLLELIIQLISTLYEISVTIIESNKNYNDSLDKNLPSKNSLHSKSSNGIHNDLSHSLLNNSLCPNLIYYEEIENDFYSSQDENKIWYNMHHKIPLKPFRCTILLNNEVNKEQQNNLLENSYNSTDNLTLYQNEHDFFKSLGCQSPASFPPTPFSRTYVLKKHSDQVIARLFAARDILRLDAQSESRDEHTRKVAREALIESKLAKFDPNNTSSCISLACSDHCAVKISSGLCGSTRSMLAIKLDIYVYFEFSIIVENNNIPTLNLGLARSDCPLNVMVGGWPHSIGLQGDGQILAHNRWYQAVSKVKVSTGSTIGMLVYIPSNKSKKAKCNDTNLTNFHDVSSYEEDFCDNSSYSSSNSSCSSSCSCSACGLNEIDDLSLISNNSQNIDDNSEYDNNDEEENVTIRFNINGVPIVLPDELNQDVNSLKYSKLPLIPTVCLFSQATHVWCRFCAADIVHANREIIQAPPGVRVYCLDGSPLLGEN